MREAGKEVDNETRIEPQPDPSGSSGTGTEPPNGSHLEASSTCCRSAIDRWPLFHPLPHLGYTDAAPVQPRATQRRGGGEPLAANTTEKLV